MLHGVYQLHRLFKDSSVKSYGEEKTHLNSTNNSILGQPIDKSDQFGNPTGLDRGLPLLQTPLSLTLAQQAAKVLRELEDGCDGLVALDELVQIGRLLCGAVCFWPHHHERNASRRRRLVQDDRLFADGTSSPRTKRAKPQLKRAPRPRVSLRDNFLLL
jgi:hypothetical protein